MQVLPPPTPKDLLLHLMVVAPGGVIDSATAVRAGSLFDISENSTRVTLARLASGGVIDQVERGVYQLGLLGRALSADLSTWRDMADHVEPWNGAWLVVLVSNLARGGRSEMSCRQRALSLLGMRELEPGFFLRPNNLRGGAVQVRSRLRSLGVEQDVPVFVASDLDEGRQDQSIRLWDGDALNDGYRHWRSVLSQSGKQLKGMTMEDAARSSYLLGDAALRALVFDPLLPEPFVSVDDRVAMVEEMKAYDEIGKRVWQQFLSRPSSR